MASLTSGMASAFAMPLCNLPMMCAGVPAPIINRIYDGMAKALAMPDVKDAIARQGSKALSSASPEAFTRYIKSETEKFYPVIQAAGLEGSQ